MDKTDPPAKVASNAKLGLPPLPDAGHYSTGPFGQSVLPWFSADQMQAYAEAARVDLLERLAAAAESEKHAHTDWVDDDVRVRHPRA